MWKTSAIAGAFAATTLAIAVAVAPTASAVAPACVDYFDCGYAIPGVLTTELPSGEAASGSDEVEFTPVIQGPPIYNEWRPTWPTPPTSLQAEKWQRI